MTFSTDRAFQPVQGQLIYDADEFSFRTEPQPPNDGRSIGVNYLQIFFDPQSAHALFVEGYSAYQGWRRQPLMPPRFETCGLILQDSPHELPARGVARRLNNATKDPWSACVDASSGWLCVGDSSIGTIAINFAPGAVASLNGRGELVALWLRPRSLPDAVTF